LKATRSTIALDSSAVIAGLLSWHQHHQESLQALEEIFVGERGVVLPLPALLETYSVMTRLPAPHRLSPESALDLLVDSPLRSSALVGLAGEEGWDFVRTLATRAVSGGRSYDALIVACAKKGGARQILTLNRRHFEGLDPDIEVVVP
jgi:predicted nucleic acid-binding protein